MDDADRVRELLVTCQQAAAATIFNRDAGAPPPTLVLPLEQL